jgi:hypothetical protein
MEYLFAFVVLVIGFQLFAPRSLFRRLQADNQLRRESIRYSAERHARLHLLSSRERAILRPYVVERQYDLVQNPQEPAVQDLIARGILRPVADRHSGDSPLVFTIAAWARSYLASRPELLDD